MKPELKISIADLGKLFAEYCMSQGIIEDFDDNEVSLTEKGIETLQGAPYYFDLEIGRDEGAITEDYLESETTFTWYQKNFQPGRRRLPMSDDRQRRSGGNEDMLSWRPGISSPQREEWRPPQDRPQQNRYGNQNKKYFKGKQGGQQHQGGQQKPQQQHHQHHQQKQDLKPIKMEVDLPPIARTNYNKYGKFNNKPRNNNK